MDVRGFVTGLIVEVAQEFSIFGLIDKFLAFFETNSLFTFIVFALSIFLLYKLVRMAFRIFLVVIAGLLFPFIMNFVFGWSIPISINILIFYATSAVVIYLLATFLKGAGKILGKITAPLRKSSDMREIEENVREDLEEERKKRMERKKKLRNKRKRK